MQRNAIPDAFCGTTKPRQTVFVCPGALSVLRAEWEPSTVGKQRAHSKHCVCDSRWDRRRMNSGIEVKAPNEGKENTGVNLNSRMLVRFFSAGRQLLPRRFAENLQKGQSRIENKPNYFLINQTFINYKPFSTHCPPCFLMR